MSSSRRPRSARFQHLRQRTQVICRGSSKLFFLCSSNQMQSERSLQFTSIFQFQMEQCLTPPGAGYGSLRRDPYWEILQGWQRDPSPRQILFHLPRIVEPMGIEAGDHNIEKLRTKTTVLCNRQILDLEICPFPRLEQHSSFRRGNTAFRGHADIIGGSSSVRLTS